MSTEVVDQPDRHRLVLTEDGHEAELVYRTHGEQLVLIHTGVPDALGGRGIGGILVRAAVAKAIERGGSVRPECPFARKWLTDHPEVAATVSIDWP